MFLRWYFSFEENRKVPYYQVRSSGLFTVVHILVLLAGTCLVAGLVIPLPLGSSATALLADVISD